MSATIINMFVEKYLNKIISDFNREETKSNLLSGSFTLNKVTLNPNILKDLNCSYLELKKSLIDTIDVKVSFPYFYSNPIKVTINKLFLYLVLKDESMKILDHEKKQFQKLKQDQLNSIEEFIGQMYQLNKDKKEEIKTPISELLFNNIQLVIENVVIFCEYPLKTEEKTTYYRLGFSLKKFEFINPRKLNKESDTNVKIVDEKSDSKTNVKYCSKMLNFNYGNLYLDKFREIIHEKESEKKQENQASETLEKFNFINSLLKKNEKKKKEKPDEKSVGILFKQGIARLRNKRLKEDGGVIFHKKYVAFDDFCEDECLVFENKNETNKRHNYIFENINFYINCSFESDFLKMKKPFLKIVINIEKLNVNLTLEQIQIILEMVQSIYNGHLILLNHINEFMKIISSSDKETYINDYTNYFKQKYIDKVDKIEFPKSCSQIEENVTYKDIMKIRLSAYSKIPELEKISFILKDFGDTLFKNFLEENQKKFDGLKYQRAKTKLLNSDEINDKLLEKEPVESLENVPEKSEIYNFEIKLEFINIILHEGKIDEKGLKDMNNTNQTKEEQIIELFNVTFNDFIFKIIQKKIEQKIELNLSDIVVFYIPSSGRKKKILYATNEFGSDGDIIFSLEYEYNPISKYTQHKLKIESTKQLFIILNFDYWCTILLKMERELKESLLKVKPLFKSITKNPKMYYKKLTQMIEGNPNFYEYKHFYFDINIVSPLFVLPIRISQSGRIDSCIFIYPGKFEIKTLEPSQSNNKMGPLYKNYLIKLIEMNIFYSERYNFEIGKENTFETILDKFNIDINLDTLAKTNMNEDENKMVIKLDTLILNISDKHLKTMFLYYQSASDGIDTIYSVFGIDDSSISFLSLYDLISPIETPSESQKLVNKKRSKIIDENEKIGMKYRIDFSLKEINIHLLKVMSEYEQSNVKGADIDSYLTKNFFSLVIIGINFNSTEDYQNNIKAVINFETLSLYDYDHIKTLGGKENYYLAHEYRCVLRSVSNDTKINKVDKNNNVDNIDENEQCNISYNDDDEENVQGCFSLIYNFNFEKNKKKFFIKFGKIQAIPNISTIYRVYTFLVKLDEFRIANFKTEDNSLHRELESFQLIQQQRNEGKIIKGINPNYFRKVRNNVRKKGDKNALIEDQSKETFSKNQEESIITRNEHNVYKKIFDFKSSVLVEISNISLKIPIKPKEPKCVSFNLDCSLVIRMKTDSKIELEFNKETDEITYFNYLNRNIYTSFLLSNVMIRIEEFIENEIIKYDIINNFRISARSDDILVVNSKNSMIQSYLIIEPVKINFLCSHIKLLNIAYKDFNDLKYGRSGVRSTSTRMSRKETLLDSYERKQAVNEYLKSKRQLREKIEKYKRDVLSQQMYNIAGFNVNINFELEFQKLQVILYDENESGKKIILFNLHFEEMKMNMISNTHPSDGKNMGNCIIEMIGEKEIPFNQYNKNTMFIFESLETKFSVFYFNSSLNGYEPLIEPYHLLYRKTKVSKETRLKYELISDTMLNINVTPKGLYVLNKTLNILQNENVKDTMTMFSTIKKREEVSNVAIIFKNRCGERIDITFSQNYDESLNSISLDDGEEQKYSQVQLDLVVGKNPELFNQKIGYEEINFAIKNYNEVFYFDFSKNKSSNIILTPKDDKNPNYCINVSVNSKNLIKYVIFSSNFMVKNTTDIEGMKICYEEQEKDLIKNKKIFLPLEWAANYDQVNFKYQDETFPIFNNILNAKTELFAFLSRKSINSQKSLQKERNLNTTIDPDKRVIKLIDKNQKNSPAKYICIDSFALEPIDEDAEEKHPLDKNVEDFCFNVFINSPIKIESQIPSFFPFYYINFTSEQRFENEIKFGEDNSIYAFPPDDTQSLMKILIKMPPNMTYESYLFNIFEGKDTISVIKDDGELLNKSIAAKSINDNDIPPEEQFNISLREVDETERYLHFNDIFKVIPDRSLIKSKFFIFYIDYIVINKTMLNLYLIPSETTLNISYNLPKNKVSLLSSNRDLMTLKCKNRISRPFRINTIGLSGLVNFEPEKKEFEILSEEHAVDKPEIAMTIESSYLFPNSSIITFEPRYMFINKIGFPIKVKPFFDEDDTYCFSIDNETEYPLIYAKKTNKYMIGINGNWSEDINIENISEIDVKIEISKDDEYFDNSCFSYDNTKFYMIIRVSTTTIDSALIYITFSKPRYPLFEICNNTNTSVDLSLSRTELVTVLPFKTVPFVRKEENSEVKCHLLKTDILFSFARFDKKEVQCKDKNVDKIIKTSVSTSNNGFTRLFKIEIDIPSKDISVVRKIFLNKKVPKITKIKFSLKGIGISLINSKPQEIAYISIYGLDLKYSNSIDKNDAISENNETIQFFIKNVQIDYCLNDWDKKVIFVPKNQILPSNEEKLFKEDKEFYPFLQLLICRQKTNNLKTDEKVDKYPQIDFILQEFVINIAQISIEKIIQTIKEYYSILTILHMEQRNIIERQSNLLTTEITIPDDDFLMGFSLEKKDSGMLLFNYIFFSAIKFELNINFDLKEAEKYNIPIFIRKLSSNEDTKEIIFENGQIKFREMIYENAFIGLPKLNSLLIKHYITQTINQFYHNLGNKNLITNPIKLLDSVGTGFIELVNETRKGFMLGPGYFGKRLNLGIHSLINNLFREGKENLTTATGTLLNMQNDNNIGEIRKQIERNRNKYITKGSPLEIKSDSPCLNGIFLNPYKGVVIDGVQTFYKKLKNSNLSNNSNNTYQSSAIIFEMKNDSIKYFPGKVIEDVRFRHPRVITENETIKIYKENLAEVQELLEENLRIYDTNKILFYADTKGKDNNYITLIMTDKIFIILDKEFKIIFELKVDDVEKIDIINNQNEYNLDFENKGSEKKSYTFYELKVVSKLYDLFRQQIRAKVDTERINTEKSLKSSIRNN